MPKNKPSKKVSLTRTKKKGLINKRAFIDEIRKCVEKYEYMYVFSHENMRNKLMQDVRLHWRDNSRFFFGKNRVAAIALGRTSAEEISENLHLMSEKLIGNRALFLTSAPKEEVLEYFDNLKVRGYARAGTIATDGFEVPEGLLSQFTHTLEPYLRKLGLPTELRKGVPALSKPFTVCKRGDILNPDQAKILKLFEQETSYFKITMEFFWSKGGSFEDLGRATDVAFTKKPPRKSRKVEKIYSEAAESGDEEDSDEDDSTEEEEEKVRRKRKAEKISAEAAESEDEEEEESVEEEKSDEKVRRKRKKAEKLNSEGEDEKEPMEEEE